LPDSRDSRFATPRIDSSVRAALRRLTSRWRARLPQPARRWANRLVGLPPRPMPPLPPSYPDWTTVLGREADEWQRLRRRARGPRVVIATSVGGFAPGVLVEGALAVALTLRGARVQLLLCDEVLPACLQATANAVPSIDEFVRSGPAPDLCAKCFPRGFQVYERLGLPLHHYSDFLDADDHCRAHTTAQAVPLAEIRNFEYGPLAVGAQAYANAIRFFARDDLESEPAAEAVLRRFLEGALLSADVASRVFRRQRTQVACFHHGLYVPQGSIVEAAREQKVRVVNWNAAYRKQCFLFSQGESYHFTFGAEPNSAWEDMAWSEAAENHLLDYLDSRSRGTRDWIFMNSEPVEDLPAIAAQLGLDYERPWVGLLTNLMWDAQLFYPSNAYASMLAWILDTIAYFAQRTELQLIIRVHPAEIKGGNPTRQPILQDVRKVFPTLPPNIVAIPAESPISTYSVMRRCNAVLIYGTKAGLELACQGIPTIVAGEAWMRNKGFTYDASSPEEYHAHLDRLPFAGPLEPDKVLRARKYAFHFFFRRMVPLEVTESTGGWPPFKIQVDRLSDLAPGRHAGLDLICDGILRGTPFIYPAERQFLGTDS